MSETVVANLAEVKRWFLARRPELSELDFDLIETGTETVSCFRTLRTIEESTFHAAA